MTLGIRVVVSSSWTVRVAIPAAVMSFSALGTAAEIRWRGDAACRRELEVTEQVTSMIGRDLSSVESADFELVAQSAPDGTWHLELKTVRRADGSQSARSLQGESCVEVTDAAAVAIALAVGPDLNLPASPTPSKSDGTVVADSSPPAQPQAPKRAHARPNRSSRVGFVGLAGVLDSSMTPKVALGAALHLGLSWLPTRLSSTRLRLELEGALYGATESAISNGRGGTFRLGYVAPLVCGERPLADNALLGCLGYELGQLSGEGSGAAVSMAHHRGTFWHAARAELGLLVPLGAGLRAFVRGGAALAMVRREFALDGTDLVFRPAALSARGQLGLELSF